MFRFDEERGYWVSVEGYAIYPYYRWYRLYAPGHVRVGTFPTLNRAMGAAYLRENYLTASPQLSDLVHTNVPMDEFLGVEEVEIPRFDMGK